jgi:uncharacterized protein involved in exopolysaccharide biosynthesis
MSPAEGHNQTGLREYALQLWARKLVIIIVFLLAVGGTLVYCVVTTAKYSGTSELLLTPTLSPTLLEANGGLTQNQLVDVPSDIQIIQSAVVRSQVSQTIPNPPTATVAQVGTTDVVQITTTDKDAQVAAAASIAYAHQYISFEQDQTLKTLTNGIKLVQKHLDTVHLAIGTLQAKITATTAVGSAAGLQSQLNILNQENAALEQQLANYESFSNGSGTQSGQIISFATVPSKPSSPKTLEWTIIAALLGLLVGVGAAMLVESLADKSTF